jgi:hypothetical protein
MDTQAAQIRKLEIFTISILKQMFVKKDISLGVKEMQTFSSVKKNAFSSATLN